MGSMKKKWKYIFNLGFYRQKQKVLIKYTELWVKIENLTKCNSIKACQYRKDFMKIKFNSEDNMPLKKILKLYNIILVI